MMSKELPMNMVSQLGWEKKDKNMVQRNLEFLMWEYWEEGHGEG